MAMPIHWFLALVSNFSYGEKKKKMQNLWFPWRADPPFGIITL